MFVSFVFVRVSFVERGLCLFHVEFGYCSAFWSSKLLCAFPTSSSSSVASLRHAKGRAVVVDPVSGWFEIFLLREDRWYNSPECSVVKVFGVVLVVVELVAWLGFFRFELVRFVLLFHLFSVFEFGIGILVGWVWTGLGVYSGGSWVEGCLLICVWSLVGRSLLIRDRELVSSTHVLQDLLMSPPAYRMLGGGRIWSFEATYRRRLLFWSLLVVLENWLLLIFHWMFGVFLFSFWCNTWDLIPFYI